MKVKVVAFGIARNIIGNSATEVELDQSSKIADLRYNLTSKYPEFENLRSLKFAVNEDYQEDSYQISPDDEIVIIPPVSGG